jgi:predicted nucleotidyltransferase
MNGKYLNLSNKVEDYIVEILEAISDIAHDLNLKFFVIGAIARDVIFTNGYNVPTGRATNDIDLGICMGTWDTYDTFVNRLHIEKKFAKTKVKHKYLYRDFPVDIIPFGDITTSLKVLKWPQDEDKEMNLLGFEEAYENAIIVNLQENPLLEIPFVSPVGYAILKLISWDDRKNQAKRDAQDLFLVIKDYANLGNEKRLYEMNEIFEQEDFDYEIGSAMLLGYDIATIASDMTLTKIIKILREEISGSNDYRLVEDMLSLGFDNTDQFKLILILLRSLLKGIGLKKPI